MTASEIKGSELRELAERFPEINPNNYNEDDVLALNNWGCEVFDALISASSGGMERGSGSDEVQTRCVQSESTTHRESVAESGWRSDLDNAPKDGTEINGYRPDQGVFTFRWAWMEEFVPKNSNGDPTEDYDDTFASWWHDRWGWLEKELTPTLWRPLPEEPLSTDAINIATQQELRGLQES